MPTSYYRIENLMPGLNGLIVRVDDDGKRSDGYRAVSRVYNTNISFGDSTLSHPVNAPGLLISLGNLQKVDDPTIREFATDNPFGELQYEGHWSKGNIHVDYALYEKIMTVNVKDTSVKPTLTVYSQNYIGDFRVDAEESIQQVLRDESDIDDLVFSLQDIAAAQKGHMKEETDNG